LLGIDPLYVANEGKAVLIVRAKGAKKVLRLLKKHPLGQEARIIGEMVNSAKKMVLSKTLLGTTRLLEMLDAEVLPRIC
jgi:hydrogenase expression/formation protein HypE